MYVCNVPQNHLKIRQLSISKRIDHMQKIKTDLLPFIRCFPFISHCYSSLTLLTFARFCIPLITIRLSIIFTFGIASTRSRRQVP